MGRTNRLIIALLLVVALAVPFVSATPALAADTGYQYPTSVSTQAVNPEDDYNWTNAGDIKADDGDYASCKFPEDDSGTHSYRIEATNFNFDIPAGATIVGIRVQIQRYESSSSMNAYDYRVQLLDGDGNLVGSNHKDGAEWSWWDDEDTETYGHSTDTWGASPTEAMVEDPDFGVVLSFTGSCSSMSDRYGRVDYIKMKVYYQGPTHTITASDGPNGEIDPEGAVTVDEGNNQTFDMTPDPGYIVAENVMVDAAPVAGRLNKYTFTNVTTDHTIAASFENGWYRPYSEQDYSGNWSNDEGAYTSNNDRASADESDDDIRYYDFNIPAIPDGATIDGIEVAVEGYTTDSRQAEIDLSWNGSSYTSNKTTDMPSDSSDDEATRIFGGPSDTWGRTWSYDEFTNANFRVRLDATGGSGTLYVDQLQVKVYYTPCVCVTINQDSGQADPTTDSPILFTVHFSETVSDFDSSDVTLSGTAGATTATVTGSGQDYDVEVSGMTQCGTVIADIPAGVVTTGTNPNCASTSDDNTVTYYLLEDNPSLPERCGADIVLVLDSSGSIDPISLVKDPAHIFADAFLTNPENLIGVVEFDTTVQNTQDLTDSESAIDTAIDGIISGGYTNWEAGLNAARLMLEGGSDRNDVEHPDLIIIITNGDPNRPTAGPLAAAIIAANAAKTSSLTLPIRILYVGVSGATTNGELISGTNVHPDTANSITIDCITADFSELAGILAARFAETCVTTCPTTTDVGDETVTYNDSDQTVTLTATVAGCDTVSEGTVTFTVKDDGTQIGLTVTLVPVSGGIASAPFTLPGGTGAGIYTIYAEYSGTVENFNPSSGSGKLTVEKASTTLRLRSWPNPSRQGWPVYFVAMVMSTSGMPTGTITFKDGGRIIGTMTVGAGSVKFIYHRFRAGNHLITAVYSGDDNFLGCTSNTLLQRVRRR